MTPPSASPSSIPTRVGLDRRTFMSFFSGGMAATALPSLLWADLQQEGSITTAMVATAERVVGLEFTDEERELMLANLNRNLTAYRQLRELEFPNAIQPAVIFDPLLPGHTAPSERRPFRFTRPRGATRPANLEALAFEPVTTLSELIRIKQVSSVELTRMYLDRLRRHGPTLECVVTLTDDLALQQAARADDEMARGLYRGPLHGIPWGAKDLMSVAGYRTTWGAKPYEDQTIFDNATVVRRLEEAGAVLVAKLTLGALAQGDFWYGGRTRNPWNLEQGSSGSSAGSAAATAAGLVAFSLGTETLGSIVSPSTRCGVSGLRPTFGRVSRYGAMALSWTMDKVGPMCRRVEDCALVFNAIHGADDKDPTARTLPFNWDPATPLSSLRVGYFRSAFDAGRPEGQENQARADQQTLATLRGLGVELIPVELPDDIPTSAMRIILTAEAAAAFDDLTTSEQDELLTRQGRGAWPNTFRSARLIPAVEYIQANRLRTVAMGALAARLEGIDVFVSPTGGNATLLLTNLTGHPTAVVPNGFRENGTPMSVSFVGKLYGDAEALLVAKAYQDATDFHTRRPADFV